MAYTLNGTYVSSFIGIVSKEDSGDTMLRDRAHVTSRFLLPALKAVFYPSHPFKKSPTFSTRKVNTREKHLESHIGALLDREKVCFLSPKYMNETTRGSYKR